MDRTLVPSQGETTRQAGFLRVDLAADEGLSPFAAKLLKSELDLRGHPLPKWPNPAFFWLLPHRWLLADDAVIKQVKEANDIVDVVGGYVALRQVGATFKGLCPFHDDHNPSFDVDPRRQRFRCWSCNKYGDVFSFIQEHERVDFREALELLARRAGISLENKSATPQARSRALMLDIVHWAAEQYQLCLLEDPLGLPARRYLGERRLTGETVRRFGLGFAPSQGDWLLRLAREKGHDLNLLKQVGLIARRQDGSGYYDRFRDRVMFPIRNPRGQPVGFGGRILPESPLAERGPKYYNSTDTLLFKKSELLFGLDLARPKANQDGLLAVVEGYTDVMMAHQMGVTNVVATMGTALNASHVRELKKFAAKVMLVFDADEGGKTGTDRALEVFVSHDVDLAIATLPHGMDPCDLLVAQGPEPFRAALAGAVDALDFKLNQVLSGPQSAGVVGQRQAVESLLKIVARAPESSGQAAVLKMELILTRIAHRLSVKEETLWQRLRELKQDQSSEPLAPRSRMDPGAEKKEPRRAPAASEEKELVQLLLAEPQFIDEAASVAPADDVRHPGLRQILEILYELRAAGQPATADEVRLRVESPELAEHVLNMQEMGLMHSDKAGWWARLRDIFKERRRAPIRQAIQTELQSTSDHAQALELLRKLQTQKEGIAN